MFWRGVHTPWLLRRFAQCGPPGGLDILSCQHVTCRMRQAACQHVLVTCHMRPVACGLPSWHASCFMLNINPVRHQMRHCWHVSCYTLHAACPKRAKYVPSAIRNMHDHHCNMRKQHNALFPADLAWHASCTSHCARTVPVQSARPARTVPQAKTAQTLVPQHVSMFGTARAILLACDRRRRQSQTYSGQTIASRPRLAPSWRHWIGRPKPHQLLGASATSSDSQEPCVR